jgi:hypothetical protein
MLLALFGSGVGKNVSLTPLIFFDFATPAPFIPQAL